MAKPTNETSSQRPGPLCGAPWAELWPWLFLKSRRVKFKESSEMAACLPLLAAEEIPGELLPTLLCMQGSVMSITHGFPWLGHHVSLAPRSPAPLRPVAASSHLVQDSKERTTKQNPDLSIAQTFFNPDINS